MTSRRTWLRTAAGLLAAPAVVRAESLMRLAPRKVHVLKIEACEGMLLLPGSRIDIPDGWQRITEPIGDGLAA